MTTPAAGEEPTPELEPSDADPTKMEKLSLQLRSLIGSVVDKGVGPITGSVSWAEDRLARVQGDRYDASQFGSRKPLDADAADVEKVIKRLIGESVAAGGTNGFVTGLGGMVTLIVAIPVNTAGALIINARLAGAIAYLRGYKLDDPHTQTAITLVVLGSSAQQALRAVGVSVGQKAAMQALKKLPIAVLHEINKKAGFMLVAKYGTKRAAVTLAKGVPLVGGVVGGAVDATMTAAVGRVAKTMFPAN